MSYPEPRYLGETGEASATLRRTSAPSDVTYTNGTTADYSGNNEGTAVGMVRRQQRHQVR